MEPLDKRAKARGMSWWDDGKGKGYGKDEKATAWGFSFSSVGLRVKAEGFWGFQAWGLRIWGAGRRVRPRYFGCRIFGAKS